LTWDFAEANAFGDAAGDFRFSIMSVTEVLPTLPSIGVGLAYQQNATTDASDWGVVISTDPPYYDNIGYRNALIFLAADKSRLQDLDEAARKYLAWESVLAEKTKLDLSPHQVTQAETQFEAADGAVTGVPRRHRSHGKQAPGVRRSSVPSARLLSWGYWRQIEPDRPDLNRRSVGQQHSNRTETVIENPPTAQFVLP
jgi:hypothetical protein